MEERNSEFTLKDLIDIIIPRVWIVAVISVIAALAVGIYSSVFVKDTYSTKLEYYVNASGTSSANLTASKDLVPVLINAYKSDIFCIALSSKLGEISDYDNVSAASLKGMLSFSQNTDVPLFSIIVTSADPNLAFEVKEAIHKLSFIDSDNSIQVPEELKDLVPHTFVLQPYANPQEAPQNANDKNTMRNALVAFVAAAAVSLVCIVLYAFIDPTVRDRKKLENGVSVPVLGVIPKYEDV